VPGVGQEPRHPLPALPPRPGSGRPGLGAHRRVPSSAEETAELLALLRTPRLVDLAPAQVWAIALDEGRYPASISTMYRMLRSCDEARERRAQVTHPARGPGPI